jgi:hypothetical protein
MASLCDLGSLNILADAGQNGVCRSRSMLSARDSDLGIDAFGRPISSGMNLMVGFN